MYLSTIQSTTEAVEAKLYWTKEVTIGGKDIAVTILVW